MSSPTVSKNINTNTRTSRRNSKKGQKMSLREFYEQEEASSAAVQVQEPESVPESVVVEPETAPESETAPEPEQPAEPKPVVNYWDERRKKVAEALKAADEAIKAAEFAKQQLVVAQNLACDIEPSPKPEPVVVMAEEAQPVVDDGFQTVSYKKKSTQATKPYKTVPQAYTKQQAYTKPHAAQQTKPQAYTKQQAYTHQVHDKTGPTYKPRTARYELTEEQKVARQHKNQALEIARKQMIDLCVALVPKKDIASISAGFQYEIGYRKTMVLDISDDAIVVSNGGEQYQFSKIQFLEDRSFQWKVRESFERFLPEVWVKFFNGRKEGTFCLGLACRKD